jgi:filamentous hemagglutinin family protein
MQTRASFRPWLLGGVVGLSLGKSAWVGGGVAMLLAAAVSGPALAAPEGGRVERGQATIRQRGNTTVIRAADRTVINFDRFNVGRDETVRFVQPNSTSRVLNRIAGDDPSRIDGTIRANGIVYIVNPAGVYFGQGALVDVGQIYAAAGDISTRDFMRGSNTFTNLRGEVVNQGTIKGDVAALIGERVSNAGTITSNDGVIAMVSGDSVVLNQRGGTMSVKLADSSAGARPGSDSGAPSVENTGLVDSGRGRALMVAGDMASLAVRNTGTVRGKNVKIDSRGDGIVEVGGTVSARNRGVNGRGGTVTITGDRIALIDANIDASGNRGGGVVRVGGDKLGQGPLDNATSVQVNSKSSIRADALRSGDGGDVVVWSDRNTGFYGSASARGNTGGHGGFIETSGKETISVAGARVRADALDPKGRAGLWLLDPFNVTINATSTSGGTFSGGNPNIFTPTGTSTILNTDIDAALTTGTTVEIRTGGAGGALNDGDINVDAAITKGTPGSSTLILRAANNVNVNAAIVTGAGELNVQLLANNAQNGNVDNNPNNGSVNFVSGGNVTTGGGAFTSSGIAFNNAAGADITTGGGNVTLNHTGVVTIPGIVDAGAGSVSVTASDVLLFGGITGNGGITLAPSAGQNIAINDGTGTFSITAAELALLNSTGTVTIGSVSAGTVNVGSAGAIDLSGRAYDLALSGSSITLNNTLRGADNQDVSLASTGNITGTGAGPDVRLVGTGNVSFASGGNVNLRTDAANLGGSSATGSVTLRNAQAIALSTLSAGTTLSVTASGSITGSSAVTSGGDATFITTLDGGAGIALGNASNSFGNITARTRNFANTATEVSTISIRESGPMSLAAVETGGAATFVSGGAITQTGALSVGDAATFVTRNNAGADITLTDAGNSFTSLVLRARNAADTADAEGDIAVTQTGTMSLVQVRTGGGELSFTSAGIDINTSGGPNILAGTGTVTFAPLSGATSIALNDAAGTYSLTAAELLQISTSGRVNIGAPGATGAVNIGSLGALDLTAGGYDLFVQGGATTFNNGITLADDRQAWFIGSGISSDHAGVDVTIGGTNGRLLTVAAGGSDIKSSVARYAGTSSLGFVRLTNSRADGLTIDTVRTTNGVSGSLGGVSIVTTGPLVVSQAVGASGNGAVLLQGTGATASAAINAPVTSAAGTITIRGENGMTFAADGDVTSTSGDITADARFANVVPGSTMEFSDGAQITTGDSASVTLRAGGDIRASAGTGRVVRASRLDATSTTGTVGANNTLRTEVFGGTFTGATGVDITNNRDLQATFISSGGNVRVRNTGVLSTIDAPWTANSFDIGSTGQISFTQDVTAASGPLAVDVSNGGLLVANGRTVRTTNAPVSISALDVELRGSLSSGTSTMTIERSSSAGVSTIGIGTGTGDLRLDGSELSRITADQLTVGGANINLISVTNVAQADSANIGELRLRALSDGGRIVFGAVPSTFNGLDARALAGIRVGASITVRNRDLLLNADADTSGEAGHAITFAAATTLTTLPSGGSITLLGGPIAASESLTISSNQGVTLGNSISSEGPLTISARTGITLSGSGSGSPISLSSDDGLSITDDLTSTGGNVVFNADADADGTGTFALSAGKEITTASGNVSITAADAQIDGTIDAGTGVVSIARATAGSIGLGTGFGDLNLSGDELSRLTGSRLEIGNSLTSFLNVGNVSGGNLSGIATLVSLIGSDIDLFAPLDTGAANLAIARGTSGTIGLGNASGDMTLSGAELGAITTRDLTIGSGPTGSITVNGVNAAGNLAGVSGLTTLRSGGTVTFASSASSFRSLAVNADNGITVNTNLSTTVGDLSLNGDADSTADGNDGIAIFANRTISSAGSLTMAGSGGISSVGAVSLLAGNGVTISNDASFEGTTTINADQDGSGGGTLTVASASALRTNGNALNITAADIALDGSANTGAGSMTIRRSSLGTIGMGTATGNMTLSGAELGRIVATGLTVGGTNTTGFTVAGVTATNSNGIAGITTLESLGTAGTMTFDSAASTFNALTARAASNITVAQSVTTDSGGLFLDGGANTANVNDGLIALAANLTIPASQDMTFNSPVELRRNITTAAKNVTFASRVNSGAGTARSLTVNTNGNGVTRFGGPIGQNRELLSLTTNADGRTLLGGNVRVSTGTMSFGDGVTLTNDVTLRSDSENTGVFFGKTVNSDANATPRALTILTANNQPSTADAVPVISFARSVGTRNALRELNLNFTSSSGFTPRTEVPRVATIIARPRDNNGNVIANPPANTSIRIVSSGGVRMGQFEKLTAGGDLRIDAGGPVVLGDVTTLGDFTVNAPSIVLQTRPAGRVLGPTGTITAVDRGVDYVSGGEISFSVRPTFSGSFLAPTFATPDGTGDATGNLTGFLFQAFGDVVATDLNNGTPIRTLDLRGEGPTNTNLAESIAGAIPRESRQNDVGQSTQVGQAQAEELKQLGIIPRNPTAGELIEFLQGAATYDDRPQVLAPGADDFKTVVTRLPSDRVSRLLSSYDELFNKPGDEIGPDGKAVRTSRIPDIQNALAASVKRYRDTEQKTGDIDALRFRKFLETKPDEAESLGYVRQMQGFLRQLELIGLTSRELNVSKNVLLNPVRPRGIRTVQQLEAIVKADTSLLAMR